MMAENLTPARPYAKAIFALALRDNTLHEWAAALHLLSIIAAESQKHYILKNPKFRRQQKIKLFFDPAHAISLIIDFPEAENLLRLLMLHRRLTMLPQITQLYNEMLHAHENLLEVKAVSAMELTTKQCEKIVVALEKRYHKKIKLITQVDANLIGGAIIYAGDKVLDGSIKGKLERLSENLG